MMKTIKHIVSSILFCLLTLTLVVRVGDILVLKEANHYYIMDQEIASIEDHIQVQIFGSCHSYTSFQAAYFEENYGYTAYDLGNPGELIPVTYLRMKERFEKDKPEVALVEIWGVNAHETYHSAWENFEYYMPGNVERMPLSLDKIEVIQDYYSLDLVNENFAIAKYKDRIMNMELYEADFEYSLEAIQPRAYAYTKVKMQMRKENNGFCEMPFYCFKAGYKPYLPIPDYHELQPVVGDATLELEPDMVKYLDKIIDLCEEYDVELIFYRSPYISTANELKKANWLAQYCESKGILYLDLEKEMTFDITTDFLDYHHLNEAGAVKATNFLADYLLERLS